MMPWLDGVRSRSPSPDLVRSLDEACADQRTADAARVAVIRQLQEATVLQVVLRHFTPIQEDVDVKRWMVVVIHAENVAASFALDPSPWRLSRVISPVSSGPAGEGAAIGAGMSAERSCRPAARPEPQCDVCATRSTGRAGRTSSIGSVMPTARSLMLVATASTSRP